MEGGAFTSFDDAMRQEIAIEAGAQAILDAERLKRDRRVGLGKFVRGMRLGQ